MNIRNQHQHIYNRCFNCSLQLNLRPQTYQLGIDTKSKGQNRQHKFIQMKSKQNSSRLYGKASGAYESNIRAILFDCDGVVLDSEDVHRIAYNETFKHFDVKVNDQAVNWNEDYYKDLQNKIGGGKAKMKYYFDSAGMPTSKLSEQPKIEKDLKILIDQLQEWKTTKYQEIVGTQVEPRAGVIELFDEAKQKGLKVAVCSAGTKSSVIYVLKNLLGEERFQSLDCFLAGDDIPVKKPDPAIYNLTRENLKLDPENCVVVEDSSIGLQAALGANMKCMVTYTTSTMDQDFKGASIIVKEIGNGKDRWTVDKILQTLNDCYDDRK